jgi:ribosomal protein L11 methylase PrmA
VLDLFLLVAAIGLLVAFFVFFVAGFFRSPFVPSSRRTIQKMLAVAKISPGQKIVDLGCGDGRIVFSAEKKYGAVATGFEISIFVWSLAQLNRFFKNAKSKIFRRDFFAADLREVDIVFCYLLPEMMHKLAPKFQKELRPGAKIISAGFSLPGFQLLKKYPKKDGAIEVFVYEK